MNYDIVIESNESTVVAEYKPLERKEKTYQSESQLESQFIADLQAQGYEYLEIHTEQDLIANLRTQLEKLNDYKFSENEWNSFFKKFIANDNSNIEEKTNSIQDDFVKNLIRDSGETKNIYLLDKKNIHNNFVQVINQYKAEEGVHKNRYDVTILVNGLPLVHVELKRRGVSIREAFNQIDRYQRESFWSGCGLYEYIQIFVISNGTNTKYYSNTTRFSHIKERNSAKRANGKKTSNSFEFTSFWADATNKIIPDLRDFTRTFFARHTILNILTRYCVFTSEKTLMVMRPYQIVATEKILNRIEISTNYKKTGKLEAGGYIWHTTGSGKTLTSFKTSLLASRLPYIDKVFFVVDRKDLDYQTMREYDRFEKGAANGNKSTAILQKQIEDSSKKILVTTIQKLSVFIEKNSIHPIYTSHVVLIFDECHRSQFGQMHSQIIKKFKNYHLFGFTGTPIFAENASSGGKPDLKTTPQVFGEKLHTYTIVDAIRDKNVLPFKVDFINTIKEKQDADVADKKVQAIETEENFLKPERIHLVTNYIFEHFAQKTLRAKSYEFRQIQNVQEVAKAKKEVSEIKEKKNLFGFNSIFAVSSIQAAKLYYTEFKTQNQNRPQNQQLKIATIYSYGVNEEEEAGGILGEENSDDTSRLDKSSRDFLESAISDYNAMFKTNYSTESEGFQNYYKDLSLRVKNREIDLLIVVNMFLTGFDATTLNTLWVDKNLKQHGLIQAFSRTNRILNSVKQFGNIVCFRNLTEQTNEAIALFGDKDAASLVLLKTFDEYYYGYTDENGKHVEGYVDLIMKLLHDFNLGFNQDGKIDIDEALKSEAKQVEFIKLFGKILRSINILQTFDQFTQDKRMLDDRAMQDYQGKYNDLHEEFLKKTKTEKESIADDIVFEMELIRQIEVNIDYILGLVQKYHDSNCKDKEILININKAVNASSTLRSKKELIEEFVKSISATKNIENIQDNFNGFLKEELEKELDSLIEQEKLKGEETKTFIKNCFESGVLKTTGTDIGSLLPPTPLFGKNAESLVEKRNRVTAKLEDIFSKYYDVI